MWKRSQMSLNRSTPSASHASSGQRMHAIVEHFSIGTRSSVPHRSASMAAAQLRSSWL